MHHLVSYGVHVYGVAREPVFQQAASLFHPETVARSYAHDGSGDEPGLKDPDGRWDIRPHRDRIITVDESVLRTWHEVLEAEPVPVRQTRMIYAVNLSTASVLDKLASAPRIASLELHFSRGWDESRDRKLGHFDVKWGAPESWQDVILQGPHMHVANPTYKTPNATMKHNLDWSAVDLESLRADAVLATSYKPRADRAQYDASYAHWVREVRENPDGSDLDAVLAVDPRYIRDVEYGVDASGTRVRTETVSARGFYRLAWRNMAANTGERTLIPLSCRRERRTFMGSHRWDCPVARRPTWRWSPRSWHPSSTTSVCDRLPSRRSRRRRSSAFPS
ncbi:hypothetical protein NKG05_10965 [Oerskovia sp. M15]